MRAPRGEPRTTSTSSRTDCRFPSTATPRSPSIYDEHGKRRWNPQVDRMYVAVDNLRHEYATSSTRPSRSATDRSLRSDPGRMHREWRLLGHVPVPEAFGGPAAPSTALNKDEDERGCERALRLVLLDRPHANRSDIDVDRRPAAVQPDDSNDRTARRPPTSDTRATSTPFVDRLQRRLGDGRSAGHRRHGAPVHEQWHSAAL